MRRIPAWEQTCAGPPGWTLGWPVGATAGLGVAVEDVGLVAEGAVVAGAGDCASPGGRAEVEPHPARPIKPATAASLAYRMNADKALTSN